MAQIFGHGSDLKNGSECWIEVDDNTILHDFVLKVHTSNGKMYIALDEDEVKRVVREVTDAEVDGEKT